MHQPECEQLDEFLLGLLKETQRREFEDHLNECDSCRDAAEIQSRLDATLARVPATIAVPTSVVDGIPETRQMRRGKPMRALTWALAATAAACLIALLLAPGALTVPILNTADVVQPKNRVVVVPEQDKQPRSPQTENPNLHNVAPEEERIVQVSFSPQHVVRPIRTESSKVSIYMVYPSIPQTPPQNRSGEE